LHALNFIILHLHDLHTLVLVIFSTIADEQALTTADDKGCRCAMTV
jgi:hypothetical protein